MATTTLPAHDRDTCPLCAAAKAASATVTVGAADDTHRGPSGPYRAPLHDRRTAVAVPVRGQADKAIASSTTRVRHAVAEALRSAGRDGRNERLVAATSTVLVAAMSSKGHRLCDPVLVEEKLLEGGWDVRPGMCLRVAARVNDDLVGAGEWTWRDARRR